MRVLRLGSARQPREPFVTGELATSLQRLIVLARTDEEAERLVPIEARHAGLVVEVQSAELFKGDPRNDAI